MPVLISHATADTRWAHWIAGSLHAAGHETRLDPAGNDFADRLTDKGPTDGSVLLLLSTEHRATSADWARLVSAPALVGRLIAIRLDAAETPHQLRTIPCRSLHGLDEEDALETLLTLVGGIHRERFGTRGSPPPSPR